MFYFSSEASPSPTLLSLCSEELARKLKPLGDEERAVLLKLKEEECKKRSLPFSGELHAWDTRYFMTQVSHAVTGPSLCISASLQRVSSSWK